MGAGFIIPFFFRAEYVVSTDYRVTTHVLTRQLHTFASYFRVAQNCFLTRLQQPMLYTNSKQPNSVRHLARCRSLPDLAFLRVDDNCLTIRGSSGLVVIRHRVAKVALVALTRNT